MPDSRVKAPDPTKAEDTRRIAPVAPSCAEVYLGAVTQACRRLHPSPSAIEAALRHAYGQPRHHNKTDPLGELVFILLSSQTREAEYRRTFATLWLRYRSWDRVRIAPPEDLADALRVGGFAKRKSLLIKALLERIHRDIGRTSLRFLREWRDDDALTYLLGLPGVGLKTAQCVLMYALHRSVLPVDTHVWRIAKRLGWVAGGKHPDARSSADLEAAIPARMRSSLHVTMVAHGRRVCRARPACDRCLLADVCPRVGIDP